MGRTAKISRAGITESAVRIIAQSGAQNATMRAISTDMDVNEAALYRHFKSKEELLWSAYSQIVAKMVSDKQHLSKVAIPFRVVVTEWVRISYQSFDANPDAFAYVLLLPPPSVAIATDVTRSQGKTFMTLLRRAMKNKEIAVMPVKLAYSHFSGILLNVPRLIREGVLPGPASQYVEQVVAAAWCVLQSHDARITV